MFSAIRIGLIISLIAAAGAGYLLVQKLQSDLQTARENVAKMEVAIQISEASIATLQADAVRTAELNATLQRNLQTAEQYGDELRATLRQHDLTALAQKKPGLIETRMQDATDNLWDNLRSITDPNGMFSVQPGTTDSNSN
tara:strand:+ start:1230 stop:1652 length:423 start_codon:yes stop_codon:yes gene_type:complete